MKLSIENIKPTLSLYYPGLAISFSIAATATFLSEHYTAPVMLFALLLGIGFHFLTEAKACAIGVDFAARTLLRTGIALLGVRVTFSDLSSLGWAPILIVFGLICATILVGIIISKLFGRGVRFGLLTGSAVAICGASAALAVSSVLGKDERLERDTLFTVISVTLLSTVAMVAYPILFKKFGYDDVTSGALIGATIHDVAQVIGAGYSISPEAGDTATYIKLLRVAFLPLVVITIALCRGTKSDSNKDTFPWFAVGFAATLTANSLGLIPELFRAFIESVSGWFLVAAISALGIKTSLKTMLNLGPLHFGVIVLETILLFSFAVFAWHQFV